MEKLTNVFVIYFALVAVLSIHASGQDLSKGLQAEEYVKKRPKSAYVSTASRARGTAESVRPAKKRSYRSLASKPGPSIKVLPTNDTEVADIGVTFWKFVRVSTDEDAKMLKEVNVNTNQPIVAKRVSSDTKFSIGDLLRIGIESASQDGYLYVIDREKYADGTFGASRVVYPSTQVRGNNFVEPGHLTYFPTADSYLEIAADTDIKQVAEELIIIISPTVLINPAEVTSSEKVIPDQQINAWIAKWRVDPVVMELEGGVGETMTEAEKAAGEMSKGLHLVRRLSQDDPLPQTVYRMKIRRGAAALVTVELKIVLK